MPGYIPPLCLWAFSLSGLMFHSAIPHSLKQTNKETNQQNTSVETLPKILRQMEPFLFLLSVTLPNLTVESLKKDYCSITLHLQSHA